MDTLPQDRESLLRQVGEKAFRNEKEYGNCPQCLVAAINDIFGGVSRDTMKCCFGFGGGTGLSARGLCGAVNGAVMLISSVFGRDDLYSELDLRCTATIRTYMERFEAKYAGVTCGAVQTGLMGRCYDLTIPGEKELFLDAGGHDWACTGVLAQASILLAEMIIDGELPWPPPKKPMEDDK